MLNMTICSLNNRIQVLIVHINYRERISLNLVIRLCICQAEVYKHEYIGYPNRAVAVKEFPLR